MMMVFEPMSVIYKFVTLFFVVCLLVLFTATMSEEAIRMTVVNKAQHPIELFWIDYSPSPDPPQYVSASEVLPHGDQVDVFSYYGHQFLVRLVPHIEGIETQLRKSNKSEEITVTYDVKEKYLNAHPTGLVARLKMSFMEHEKRLNATNTTLEPLPRTINCSSDAIESIREATAACQSQGGEQFGRCVASNVIDEVKSLELEKSQLDKIRNRMAWRVRNYTCADANMQTSLPTSSHSIDLADREDVRVDVLLNKTHSKIWKVENFVTNAECDVLIAHARPHLHRAMIVQEEDGRAVLSDTRKANVAAYRVNQSNGSDPLTPLFQRILDVVNHETGYQLQAAGQEDFTIIQYGLHDEYTPHCDGGCDGSLHLKGGRVATALLYCQTAIRGGATSFPKSDIFVVPQRGAATFFAYKGPDGRMDDGYTEHSGCPVLEGEKWVSTVWLRDGVSNEEPFYLTDPRGKRGNL